MREEQVAGARPGAMGGPISRLDQMDPLQQTQPAWGWGQTLVEPGDAEDAARALAALPANPRCYALRQQAAARRDLGARLGAYEGYEPEPFEPSAISFRKLMADR